MKRMLSALLLLSFSSAARAQFLDSQFAPVGQPQMLSTDKDWAFNLNGNAGATTLTNPKTGNSEIYNMISVQPEISLYKLGLGLDLYFYFDHTGKVRPQDWNKPSDILSKIWYIRWAKKGDPVYARFGGLSNATIGHGFIMGGYTNRLRYPDVRTTGAELALDGGYAGAEGVVPDVEHGRFAGGRVFVRPLHGTEIPFLKDAAIGATCVSDRNPDGNKGTSNDQVSVYGADVEVPVFSNPVISAKVYADAAQMRLGSRYLNNGSKDNGTGFAAGVGGQLLSFMSYRAEMRSVGANFIPNFFDGFYDVDRSSGGVYKADRIGGSAKPRRTGPYAEIYANILNKIRIGGSFEDLNDNVTGELPRVRAELRTDPSLFMNKFDFASQYEHRNVNKFSDLGRTHNSDTVLSTEIGYMAAQNLRLVMVIQQTFTEAGEPVKSTTIRTDFRF